MLFLPSKLCLIHNSNGGSVSLRYSMVLFAGIAAEALVYGEAEGGENDENLFRSISVLLEPPLSVAQVRSSEKHIFDVTRLRAFNSLARVYRL